MPSKISHIKAAKILHHYFNGMLQLKIAEKCDVNQATVSRCAEKFKKEASAKGIMAAAKEYGVMNEVTTLRSLATELYKSKVSVAEAKSGVKMVTLFNSLDVPSEEYKTLAKMFKKQKDPGFPKAGIKLVKLEETTGKNYTDIVNEFEKLLEEITTLKEEQEKEKESLEELQVARKEKEEELAEFLKEAGKKKAAADAEVKEKLDEAGLTLEKIAKLHPVVEKMNVLGISGAKLEQFVKERQLLEEMGVTWEKFQTVAGSLAKAGEDFNGDSMTAKLEEFGDLDKVITLMKAEKTSLQPEVEKLGKEKIKLMAEVDGLTKSKAQLENEVGHLEGSKKALGATIETMNDRKIHLQKHLAVLENDVSKLTENKKGLMEEVEQKQRDITEMKEKLQEAESIDQVLKEKQMELKELDAKIAAAGQNFQWYEVFKGAIASGTDPEVQKFLESLRKLIDEAKTSTLNPEILLKYFVDELTGGALDLFACPNCGAKLVMVKRGKKPGIGGGTAVSEPEWCPDCGLHDLYVETPLVAKLKKELGPVKKILKIKPIDIEKINPQKNKNDEGEKT